MAKGRVIAVDLFCGGRRNKHGRYEGNGVPSGLQIYRDSNKCDKADWERGSGEYCKGNGSVAYQVKTPAIGNYKLYIISKLSYQQGASDVEV